jgi:AraC family transcriptional regulator of adaptative response/methylated-DNA-[protein]-cysteine methyltransferase
MAIASEQAVRAPPIIPATYGRRGAGAVIEFTIVDSIAGRTLIAATARGICALMAGTDDARLERELRSDYGAATISRADDRLAELARRVLAWLDDDHDVAPPTLELRYTPFQLAVWRELCAIAPGRTRTYAQIARELGHPAAARAVGRAGALNPVALIIPCHRAVGSDGRLHGYRWGLELKQRLLEHESRAAVRSHQPSAQR